MTVGIQDPRSVPEGGAPAAPVFVGTVGVEAEPTTLPRGVPQRKAPPARHLRGIQRQTHMLRGIPVEIVDVQGAVARGKASSRIGVGAALGPVPAVTARALEATGGAYLR